MNMLTKVAVIALAGSQLAQAQLSAADLGNLPAQSTNSTIATTPGTAGVVRQTGWSMPGGSLIPNWSFENDAQFWSAGTGANARFASATAWSGKYVASLVGTGTTAMVDGLVSQPIRLKPGQNYTLSLMYNGSAGGATILPRVSFYRPNTPTSVLSTQTGTAYGSPGATWTEYKWTLPVQADEVLAVLTLASGPRPAAVTLQFDGILMAEGDATSMALVRDNLVEGVTIADPTGVTFQSIAKTGKDTTYLVQSVGYDAFWRPETSFLPFPATGPFLFNRIADPASAAKTFYSTRGGGTTPYSRVRYPNATNSSSEMTVPGDAYALPTGHTDLRGWSLVGALPQGEPQLYVDLQAPPAATGEAKYVYNWARDRDGFYSLSWTNSLGQMVQSAKQLKATGTNKWAFTLYEYYPNGKLKRSITPLNYTEYLATGTVALGSLSQVTSYDQAGRVIASSSPDQGVVRYWYDLAGHLRFRQRSSQAATNKYTYFRYDVFGRLISEGELSNAALTQANAEDTAYPNISPTYAGSDKPVERKGWIFDELNVAKWSARLPNVPLATVVGTTTFGGRNGWGRLVAKYHRNPGYQGGDLDEAGKLVVDVYGYDTLGRQKVVGKYLGAVTDLADRRQSEEYRYDSAGRVSEILIDKNMDQTLASDASRSTDQWYKYTFDDHGRLATISNRTTLLAKYSYDALGHISMVNLGTKTLAVQFAYSLQKQVAKINAGTATTSRNYIESLSYESAPLLSGVGAPPVRYNGQITLSVEQFTGQNVFHQAPGRPAGSEPLKVAKNYYDAAGRQTNQSGFVNRENASFDPSGVASAPNYDPIPNLTHGWTYDANDRLTSNIEGSTSYYPTSKYNYLDGTNKLDNIGGCLNPSCERDASMPNSFVYNQDGQMTVDKSSGNPHCQVYDAEGNVIQMGLGYTNCSIMGNFNYFIYDADGLMEAAITRSVNYGLYTKAKHFYVRLGGVAHKELLEVWDPNTNTRTSSTKIINLMGLTSVIGRRLATGEQQFYLKNHLGSVTEVVREDGSVVAAFDFQGMGDLRTLLGDDPLVTNKYTGKEYFSGVGLYYFGARWYDPQLGVWISPDPEGQFMNPYAYGPDFLNSIDPNGKWGWSLLKIICAPVEVVINAGSALNAAIHEDSFLDGLETFGGEFVSETVADYTAVATGAAGAVWGVASEVGNLATAGYMAVADGDLHRADRRMDDFGKAFAVSVWSPFVSDYNDLNNAAHSLMDGDLGGAFSAFGQSGINSTATSFMGMEYATNKGFGSQSYKYYGSQEDGDGYRAIAWGQSSRDKGSTIADEMGGNITFYHSYYNEDPDNKKRTYRHEFQHVRQQIDYGLVGQAIKTGEEYTKDNAPAMFGFSETDVRLAISRYGEGSKGGAINVLEIEAVLKGGQYTPPGYTPLPNEPTWDAPIFY